MRLDWNDWTISIVQMAQHVTVGSPYVTMLGNQFCHFHWRMTPVEALRAATSASAECLGVGNESLGRRQDANVTFASLVGQLATGDFLLRCGRLAPGLSADLLLVATWTGGELRDCVVTCGNLREWLNCGLFIYTNLYHFIPPFSISSSWGVVYDWLC